MYTLDFIRLLEPSDQVRILLLEDRYADLEALVNEGLDINSVDGDGWTAAFWSVVFHYPDRLQAFIDIGGDLRVVSNAGETMISRVFNRQFDTKDEVSKIIKSAQAPGHAEEKRPSIMDITRRMF